MVAVPGRRNPVHLPHVTIAHPRLRGGFTGPLGAPRRAARRGVRRPDVPEVTAAGGGKPRHAHLGPIRRAEGWRVDALTIERAAGGHTGGNELSPGSQSMP